MPRIRIKICCIQSPDEAQRAIAAGADALGLASTHSIVRDLVRFDQIIL
jgi:phosphoribosylanthranilate isomerase